MHAPTFTVCTTHEGASHVVVVQKRSVACELFAEHVVDHPPPVPPPACGGMKLQTPLRVTTSVELGPMVPAPPPVHCALSKSGRGG